MIFGGLFITFTWYAITFLIYFDISIDFEIREQENKYVFFKKEKGIKGKKCLIRVHWESNPDQQNQSPTC